MPNTNPNPNPIHWSQEEKILLKNTLADIRESQEQGMDNINWIKKVKNSDFKKLITNRFPGKTYEEVIKKLKKMVLMDTKDLKKNFLNDEIIKKPNFVWNHDLITFLNAWNSQIMSKSDLIRTINQSINKSAEIKQYLELEELNKKLDDIDHPEAPKFIKLALK